MATPADEQRRLGHLLPKPTPRRPPLQSEAAGIPREPPIAIGPGNPLQSFNQALHYAHEPKLAHAFVNNLLAVGLNSAFGPRRNLFSHPHCGAPGCRLEWGCDVFYDPHNDRAFESESRAERFTREKRYEKYVSPFQSQSRGRPLSPKRRKTSHDDSANETSPDQKPDFTTEPATPFSQKSWLALKFFLIVHHNIGATPRQRTEAVMEALRRLIPDLDYEECVAMDLLRVHYPEPNIYSDNDEDESTEGAKLHKLHQKVCSMQAEELNPFIDALCEKLRRAGYRYGGVLLPPAISLEDSREEDPYGDEACNYTLLGAVEGRSWMISPVNKDGYDYQDHQIELDDNAYIRENKIRNRNLAMKQYEHRLYLSGVRIEEATEAIRLVREMEGASNVCRVQVPYVRNSYAKEGKFWPPHFSRGISPEEIEPRNIARWVDNLSDRQYIYARESILKWMNAGVELAKLIQNYNITGTSIWNEGQTLNPHQRMSAALSPKRKFSISWSDMDEVPSNSPPDWVAEQQQLRYSMTEDEQLRAAMEESMRDNQPPAYETQPKLPTPAPIPALDRRRALSRVQEAELYEREFQWAIKLSLNPSVGDFPEDEVIDELIGKSAAPKNTLPPLRVVNDSYTSPYPPPPGNDRQLSSSPKKDIAMGGADGVHDIDIDDNRERLRALYKESLERVRPLSRSPPTSRSDGIRRIRIQDILNPESPVHEFLPSVESIEVSASEQSGSKRGPADDTASLAKMKDGLNGDKSGLDGAYVQLPITPPSLASISSPSRTASVPENVVQGSQSFSANEGRKRSIDHIMNAEGGARKVSPSVSIGDAALQKINLRLGKDYDLIALCGQWNNVIPNLFRDSLRRESDRNRRSKLSKEDREKVNRWTSRVGGQANTAIVENKDSYEHQQMTDADVDMADGRALHETARLALEQAHLAAHEGRDKLQKKQLDFESYQANLRALEQARIVAAAAAQELKWLKEDEEWNMIRRSTKSLGELLMTGNVPYTRRCEEVVKEMWRTEARPGWVARAETKKNVASLGVASHPRDSSDAESGGPLLSRSRLDSSESTGNGSSSENATPESSHDGKVNTPAEEVGDGRKARSAAIAAAYANRPSESDSGASGESVDQSEESSLNHIKQSESSEALVPTADMGARSTADSPAQTAEETVGGPLGTVDEGASPSGQQDIAQNNFGAMLHNIREVYPLEAGVWEEAVGRDVDAKVANVKVIEIQADDLAEEV